MKLLAVSDASCPYSQWAYVRKHVINCVKLGKWLDTENLLHGHQTGLSVGDGLPLNTVAITCYVGDMRARKRVRNFHARNTQDKSWGNSRSKL